MPTSSLVGAQVSEFLPCVARHPVENDFLPWTTSSCDNGRTKFSVYCRASRRSVYRDDTDDKSGRVHVVQGVMHPAEVPLVPEAQPPISCGRETPGKSVDSSAIVLHRKPAHQEYGWYYARIQSLKILATAKFVRDPLPLFTAVSR